VRQRRWDFRVEPETDRLVVDVDVSDEGVEAEPLPKTTKWVEVPSGSAAPAVRRA
jgi:hypothetical protein